MQFEFLAGNTNTDAILGLQGLIFQNLNNRQRLHCCFIDYKKAFDTINREELVKYVKMGSTGKFLRVI